MARRSITARGARVLRHVGREGLYYGKIGLIGLFRAGPRRGTPIYEEDWDVLVVLDACRFDLLAAFVEEYSFLSALDETYSLASYSRSWMRRNFASKYEDETRRTVYVTGNPFSDEVLEPSSFALLDEVWRYAWDEREGTILPRPVTDRAIEHHRRHDPERMVVHYMQPHHPFLDDDTSGFSPGAYPDPRTADPWDQVRWGQRDLDEVRAAYRRNLRYALDDVSLLLSSIDAERVVVTSDHGNALGEWGVYGHPAFAGIDPIRRVPWCVTSAEDTGEYEPTRRSTADQGYDPAEQLRQLGYH
ncbi:sulfatase-like hydrolase/transferase [Halomarina halobia]|uniref:Sulfatase-like hydrolase/transferase n=1 Tax=Halomarina halobia TaxID=3033386 RepID=A0ABD6AAZ8_9EURY|nr:sulfatase-like hydrolase/transferase [Halomarina sp. PSR21]